MSIRRMIACLLALCTVLLSAPALAAPARDAVNAEVTDEGLQRLTEALFADHLGPDWEQALPRDEEKDVSLRWRLGAYLYDITFEEGGAFVRADLYACPEEYQAALEELPQDAVIWLMNGAFSFRTAPEAPSGYAAEDWEFSPLFTDGLLSAWQDVEIEALGCSLCLPAQFGAEGEAVVSPARGVVFSNADGTARAGVSVAEGQQTLSGFQDAHPGWEVRTEEAFDRIYGFGEGAFEMWMVSPLMEEAYCLTLRFPPDRQAEYALYAELIRNSFIVWEISNG